MSLVYIPLISVTSREGSHDPTFDFGSRHNLLVVRPGFHLNSYGVTTRLASCRWTGTARMKDRRRKSHLLNKDSELRLDSMVRKEEQRRASAFLSLPFHG